MTTKLEKEFFIKFNIPKLKPCEYNYGCGHAVSCSECKRNLVYPEIKAITTLKLMKILLHWRGSLEIRPYAGTYLIETGTELYSKSGESITDAVLHNCIKHYDEEYIFKDIQKLFKKKGVL